MKSVPTIKSLAAFCPWMTRKSPVLLAAVFLMGLAAASAMPAEAQAQAAGEDPLKPSSSQAAREDALQSLPFEKLDADARAKVDTVLANVSLFRRLPVRVIQCDADFYQLLVQHPDIVVNIWRLLGVTRMSLEQTGPNTFRMADGTGTVSTLEYLYRSTELQVVYSDGAYTGPLFGKTIHCKTLAILKSVTCWRLTAVITLPRGWRPL